MAAFDTATGFVVAVENALGYALEETATKPLYKVRQAEAAKVNRRIKSNPALYTWDNLELALEHCRAKRLSGKSPVYVTYHVENALKGKEAAPPARPLGERIDAAVAHEMSTQAEGWQNWVGLLSRANGDGRKDVLAWWAEAGREA